MRAETMAKFERLDGALGGSSSGELNGFHTELLVLREQNKAQFVPVQNKDAAGKAGSDKGAGAQAGQQELTRAETLLTETVKGYNAASDSGKNGKELLTEFGPKFEQAIKVADEDYSTAYKEVDGELKKLKPDLDASKQKLQDAETKLSGALKKVPADKQEDVAADAKEYFLFDESVAQKARIADELKKVPGLLDAANALNSAVSAENALTRKDNASDDELDKGAKAVADGVDACQKIIQSLPAESRQHVAQMTEVFVNADTSDARKAELTASLKQHTGLTEAVDNLSAVEKSLVPLAEKIMKLQDRMTKTLVDCMDSRQLYAQVLEAGGDNAGAEKFMGQAQLLALKIATGDILPQQQQQQAPPAGKDKLRAI